MRRSNYSAAFLIILLYLLALSGLALTGCHSTQASVREAAAGSRHSPQAASASPSAAPSSEATPYHASKHPPRDSEFAVYLNPDYGVSFRYPRNYALVEGADSGDPALLRFQQELAAAQPGAVLVATVVVPEDAYPNTSFRSGVLQLAVNPEVTPDACRALTLSADSGLSPTSGSTAIHGIPFDWRLSSSIGGAYVENVVYAGYSNEACYEFRMEITAFNYVEPDSGVKPADVPKILRGLEKIVASVQVRPRPVVSVH
ncbi:MAG TPA: hypothetical protein VE263_12200 [Candidatus Angelobacter sp.]|nr:hypothetical protein [Candidatus Angelobacter sp.]